MDQTTQLLSRIAKNARTGAEATEQLIQRTPDGQMRSELLFQKEQYLSTDQRAAQMLTQMGRRPEKAGPMEKAGMWMGIRMDTALDTTPSHIADMMIQGATMGVIDATKARNQYPDASAEAHGLASESITHSQGKTIFPPPEGAPVYARRTASNSFTTASSGFAVTRLTRKMAARAHRKAGSSS